MADSETCVVRENTKAGFLKIHFVSIHFVFGPFRETGKAFL